MGVRGLLCTSFLFKLLFTGLQGIARPGERAPVSVQRTSPMWPTLHSGQSRYTYFWATDSFFVGTISDSATG